MLSNYYKIETLLHILIIKSESPIVIIKSTTFWFARDIAALVHWLFRSQTDKVKDVDENFTVRLRHKCCQHLDIVLIVIQFNQMITWNKLIFPNSLKLKIIVEFSRYNLLPWGMRAVIYTLYIHTVFVNRNKPNKNNVLGLHLITLLSFKVALLIEKIFIPKPIKGNPQNKQRDELVSIPLSCFNINKVSSKVC